MLTSPDSSNAQPILGNSNLQDDAHHALSPIFNNSTPHTNSTSGILSIEQDILKNWSQVTPIDLTSSGSKLSTTSLAFSTGSSTLKQSLLVQSINLGESQPSALLAAIINKAANVVPNASLVSGVQSSYDAQNQRIELAGTTSFNAYAIDPIYMLGSDGNSNINSYYIDAFNRVNGTQTLGKAIDNLHSISGGTVQDFERGSIFQSAVGTFAVTDAIATYYLANSGTLGLPTSEQITTSYGKSQTFQGALVMSSPQFGVHTLHGSLVGYYSGLSATQKDQLGAATTEEAVGGDGNWQQFFKGGSVLWKSNGTGELKSTPYTIGFDGSNINSAFTTKFNQVVGWTALGQPISNVVSFNGGKLQDFAQGTICQLGNSVLTLQGQIGLYARDEIGTFGYPTSERVTTSYGMKQEFQNGLIMLINGSAIRTIHGSIWNYYRGLTTTQQDQLGTISTEEAINSDGNWQQVFKGGTVFWKKDGTGEVKFESANIAPQAPLVYGAKASYDANSTLTLGTSYAWDSNGWQDVSKVDFWLTNAQGQRIELADATSFTTYNQNYAKFNYSTSLSGIATGDYKLNAIAYDKAGAASNQFSQALAIKAANIAPLAPLVYGAKSSYDANSTLTLGTSYAWDSNGWQDVSKVDFWLTNAQGQRIELADATSFTTYNQNYAKFNYSTSLSGIATGDYKLNAIAYDKAGAASNQFSQALAIKAANIAPSAPFLNGVKSTYDADSNLTIDTGTVWDSNGWQDISKVDFWLTNAQGQRIELADATSFTSYNANNAQFNYSTSLSGIAIGDYTLNAIAYDKAGAASNQRTQALAIKAANIAPNAPLVYGVQSSYDANSTLTLDSGYAWDNNGWQDINKVDFWLTNSQGQRIELADATGFTSYDANYAKFNYSTSLNGIAAGDYKLNAVAYDKAGAASNQFSQALTIKSANIAPGDMIVYGIESAYNVNSNITINSGYAWDSNGWQDISKVDFWLTNSQGQRIELADVNNFFYNSQNWAEFNHSISLSGIAIGDYKLNAIAYDKAGVAGNKFTQSFVITNIVKPDIDIKFFDPYNTFTYDQKRAFAVAEANWERIITNDKDSSGLFNIVVTQSTTDDLNEGQSFQYSSTLANAFIDSAINYRSNWSGEKVDIGGIDYHSRVNYNSYFLGSQSFADLVGIMMHEVGHTLGLNHEDNNTLMGPYHGNYQLLSSQAFDELERQGYKVDRYARIDWA